MIELYMVKQIIKNEHFGQTKPPGFGESMIQIFDIIGNKPSYNSLTKKNDNRRFKDKKGVFQEMEDKHKSSKETIAE